MTARTLSLVLAATALSAAPLAAQDSVPARLLEIVSHGSCDESGELPSFVVVEDAPLVVSVETGGSAPRARPPRITVRRGSEVTQDSIGFIRVAPEPQAEPPVAERMEAVFSIEALLCQSRTQAVFTTGTWSLAGEMGEIVLDIEGRIPSPELLLEAVSFGASGIDLQVTLDLRGELMAESDRELVVSATPILSVAAPAN